MVAPVLAGLANVQALGREFPELALLAHPTMGGAARIAPEVLIGQMFPLVGADAVIFPNYGGRFGYSEDALPGDRRGGARGGRAAGASRRHDLGPGAGTAGFLRGDVMLLIGGNLLWRATTAAAARRFADAVRDFPYTTNSRKATVARGVGGRPSAK